MASDVLDIFDWIVDAVSGWRYLLSPSFRRRTHKRWKADGLGTAIIEVIFGALGVIVTLLPLWLLIDWLRG